MMRWSNPLLPLFGLLLFGPQGFSQQSDPPSPQTPSQQRAGSEMCAVCHEDISLSFARNPHRAITKTQGGKWAGSECETCHGPGASHAESADASLIVSFKTASADRANQACLDCHRGAETQRGRLFGAHYQNSLACTSCHNIHAAEARPLLTAESTELCSSCHLSARAAFRRPFTHKLEQKAIDCVDCHNPHGGPPPASQTRFAANDAGCLKCHADKRGPFPFEHAPVKLEACSTCHEPHGSANPRMMTRRDVSQLCLECHTSTMQTLGGPPTGFHDLRSARFRNCTICHTKVHGSYISKDLLR
jgi:DmsE family decaheme c-type cytochrome